MADHCGICDIRRPWGGTNHLVLNGGALWIEFCPPCGEKEVLTNPETNEEISVADLFRRNGGDTTPRDDGYGVMVASPKEHKQEAPMVPLRGGLDREPTGADVGLVW